LCGKKQFPNLLSLMVLSTSFLHVMVGFNVDSMVVVINKVLKQQQQQQR